MSVRLDAYPVGERVLSDMQRIGAVLNLPWAVTTEMTYELAAVNREKNRVAFGEPIFVPPPGQVSTRPVKSWNLRLRATEHAYVETDFFGMVMIRVQYPRLRCAGTVRFWEGELTIEHARKWVRARMDSYRGLNEDTVGFICACVEGVLNPLEAQKVRHHLHRNENNRHNGRWWAITGPRLRSANSQAFKPTFAP